MALLNSKKSARTAGPGSGGFPPHYLRPRIFWGGTMNSPEFTADLALGDFDASLARSCVQASARAYAETTFSSELAQVLLTRGGGTTPGMDVPIIAFRGSANVRAWLTDGLVRLTGTVFGGVHFGFWRSTQSVMPQILAMDQKVRDQRGRPVPVVITGHSKGAGEALICARTLAAVGWPIRAVITFGGPRVGNAVWRAGYDAQSANLGPELGTSNIQHPTSNIQLGDITYRVVNKEDIVARLPVWTMGYRHVGKECFIPVLGPMRVDPPIWFKALSDLGGTFRAWGERMGVAQFGCHPVSQYTETMDRI